MTTINSNVLLDTYHTLALAREAALARGRNSQAEKLAPVVDGLRHVVAAAQDPLRPAALARPAGPAKTDPVAPNPPDFQAALAAAQVAVSGSVDEATARGQVAASMAAAGMAEMDIARQLGLTQEEVRLTLNLNGARRAWLPAHGGYK